MRTPSHLSILLCLSVCAPLLGACTDEIIEDPSFDLWCGAELCSWEVEEGHVDRVPTWHRADYGASFRETGTRISQASGDIDSQCLHFEVIADTDRSARLTLTLDFNDDGESDWEQTLPGSDWGSHEFWVAPPLGREGIVFGIEKRGEGRAVLAQLFVTDTGFCQGGTRDP